MALVEYCFFIAGYSRIATFTSSVHHFFNQTRDLLKILSLQFPPTLIFVTLSAVVICNPQYVGKGIWLRWILIQPCLCFWRFFYQKILPLYKRKYAFLKTLIKGIYNVYRTSVPGYTRGFLCPVLFPLMPTVEQGKIFVKSSDNII